MNTTDPVLDRIENAERMLRTARIEYSRGNTEDAVEFLSACRRNVDRCTDALKKTASVSELPRGKEVPHAR